MRVASAVLAYWVARFFLLGTKARILGLTVNTNKPHLLGGSYTSYDKDYYPINFNYTFRVLTDDPPLCFSFPRDLTTPSKEGCVRASKKAILTDSPASKFSDKTRDQKKKKRERERSAGLDITGLYAWGP